jgi:hypothetical protein
MTDDSSNAGLLSRLYYLGVGAVAGTVATVVMTVFRMSISRSLPPTDEFWTQLGSGVVDTDSVPDVLPALGLHVVYGAGGGAVFGAAVGPLLTGREVNRERLSTLLGTGYGLALSVFGRWVLVEWLLDQDLDPDERFVFHMGHLVYGLTLGNWFGAYE